MNPISTSILSFSTLALAAWLPGQEAANTGAAALVIKTTDADVASQVADMFSYASSDLPKTEDGECFVMSLGNDGTLKVTSEKTASGFLSLRAKPSALMSIFGDRIQQVQGQVSMMAGFAAPQMGVSPGDLNKLIEDVFAFPNQIDAIAVDVTGSPDKGFDGKVDVAAAADGWLAKFVGNLEPNKAGAPLLNQPDALLHLTTNMPATTLSQMVQPFLGIVVGGGAADKEEKAKFMAMVKDFVAQMDGTMAMALLPEKTQKMVAGLVDSQKAASLMASADYKAWRQASSEANPNADIEIKDDAAKHRDVSMTRTVAEISTPMGDEKSTTFTGIAGPYLFMTSSESEAKSVVDSILDDKVKRGALDGSALLTLSVKVAEMAATMSNGMANSEEMPRSLDLTMNRQGSALKFAFKVGL
ncbi:MAG: hypothetical protein R3F56_20880 [Planctomycetota bacterium]